MPKVEMVNVNEMTSRDLMSIAASVDFAHSSKEDIDAVTQQFNEAIQSIQEVGLVKMSAFVVNVVGENAEGQLTGGYGAAGNSATLITMIPYLEEQMRKTLKKAGGCGCPGCYRRTLVELLAAVQEIEQAQDEADHSARH